MFYLWDGRDSVTEMKCPRGLWYNPYICSCDWVIPGQYVDSKGGNVVIYLLSALKLCFIL